jgi:hypothetical protein
MRITVLALALLFTLCACTPSSLPPADGEDVAPVITASPQYSPQQTETPPPAGDWADAYAAALMKHDNWSGATILDIDGDGVPEAVGWVDASRIGPAGRIYGYEDGECAVWYDIGEPFAETFDRIHFMRDGDIVRCVVAEQSIGIAVSSLSVYELVKSTDHLGKTRIVLYTLSQTSLLYRPDHLGDNVLEDRLADEIEAVFQAHWELYQKTLSALGEEDASARVLGVDLLGVEYTAETLAAALREW